MYYSQASWKFLMKLLKLGLMIMKTVRRAVVMYIHGCTHGTNETRKQKPLIK